MRKLFKPMLAVAAAGCLIVSCSKEDRSATNAEISQEALSKIAAMGFSTLDVQVVDGNYLVEGDILLSPSDLNQRPNTPRLRIAEVEQYNTFNLVSGTPRTIRVSTSGNVPAALSAGIDAAIARYNAENLNLTFQRVSSGGDINIKVVKTGQYIASAGFPSSNGNPYGTISYSNRYINGYSAGFITTVVAHEMGHCIGFRHTDWMNRSYSCGSGGSEGQDVSGVGAVQIPGTPSGPDSGSWMLACLGATTNRPFNNNDKTALDYLY